MKKNTRKLKKAALLLCSAVLLVCISIGATVAYLTSTDEVVNTFTVGDVQITLDESEAALNGTLTDNGTTRVDHNKYKLLPGHTYTKDPTIHVAANSEDCWLFVKVDNGIANIEDSTNTIAAQMATNGWTKLNENSNIYYYNQKVVSSTSVTNVPVFGEFKISGTVDNTTLESYATTETTVDGKVTYSGTQIIVTAYAIQADGFDTATAAWTAAGSSFTA